ncbi:MAG TPA: alpha/beta hydrolase family protein [Burkholderiaceae bacterium]|nr:alpha/beta hydrolase family protein [Burkholderiaceae bacterium]
MSDFLLVHGAWHGAWCWRDVLPRLRHAGHTAHAVTLTGVGERAHLLSPAVTLQTHIDDVIGAIEAEELQDVILVGHSYAGLLITAVADRLGDRIQTLVYVDAVVPAPGESWSSTHTPETVAGRLEAARATGGLSLPPPDASVFGLAGEARDWVNRRQTPHPFAVYQAPVAFDVLRVGRRRRVFIDCTQPALATIAESRRRVRREPGWQVLELATGHDPMVSAPAALAALLLAQVE